MDSFDKSMAVEVIEDALAVLGAPETRGFAIGLCGAFYMCGLLSQAEWEGYLSRIPKNQERVSKTCASRPEDEVSKSLTRIRRRSNRAGWVERSDNQPASANGRDG